jgi:hypothetical protein
METSNGYIRINDIVVCCCASTPAIGKVIEFCNDGVCGFKQNVTINCTKNPHPKNGYCTVHISALRLATPEEVKEYEKLVKQGE